MTATVRDLNKGQNNMLLAGASFDCCALRREMFKHWTEGVGCIYICACMRSYMVLGLLLACVYKDIWGAHVECLESFGKN